METKKSLMMMAALAGLSMTSVHATEGAKVVEETVHCYGINDCKGHGTCHGKVDSCSGKNACNTEVTCSGKNSCKGKGIVSATKKACEDKKGKIAK
jgi:hypothetical protein